MTPPFRTPSKASYFFSGFHSATTSPFFGKLRMCNPSGLAGPQPQQVLFGAYFSCRDCDSFIVAALRERRRVVSSAVIGRRYSFEGLRAFARQARIRTQFMPNVK